MTHRRPANADQLLRQANRLMSSEAYLKPGHPDREHVHSTVQKIYRTVYGTGDGSAREQADQGQGS